MLKFRKKLYSAKNSGLLKSLKRVENPYDKKKIRSVGSIKHNNRRGFSALKHKFEYKKNLQKHFCFEFKLQPNHPYRTEPERVKSPNKIVTKHYTKKTCKLNILCVIKAAILLMARPHGPLGWGRVSNLIKCAMLLQHSSVGL